jgi:enoyl-CoA hydratase/carnithine racemase
MSAEDLILIEDKGDYALLRINRPRQRNAMNAAARRSLLARLDQARGVYKVLVITGTESSFCSGIDLKEQAIHSDDPAAQNALMREWIDLVLEIRRHPSIVIAAVNGFALGGGSSLINVADLALAADEAQIGLPEMGFGVYANPAGPAMQLKLSAKRAAWLVLTARQIDGKTAERWGMVNLSVPLARLEDEADALARHVARFDEVALTEAKRALDAIPNTITDFESAIAYGASINEAIRAKSDAWRLGLARFGGILERQKDGGA